jgi:tRNA (guanosine-2'-O-)-methyltransferase
VTTDRRAERMREVLSERTGWVRCAVEAVYHRHNVSAILRTCDALGIHDVHLIGADWQAPSKGPARGAERWLSLHYHDRPEQAIAELSGAGYRIWVADLQGEPVPPEQVPLQEPVCLWFGAELVGVSATAREAAHGVVCIPMRGMAQSLNVSVAAALGLRPVVERARALGPSARLSEAVQQSTLAAWLEREHAFGEAVRARS